MFILDDTHIYPRQEGEMETRDGAMLVSLLLCLLNSNVISNPACVGGHAATETPIFSFTLETQSRLGNRERGEKRHCNCRGALTHLLRALSFFAWEACVRTGRGPIYGSGGIAYKTSLMDG